MGRAAALAFAREGAKVWASDMNAKTVGEIEGKEGIRTLALDVTDEAAISKIASKSATSMSCSTAPASCTTARSSTPSRAIGTRRSR